MIQVVDAEASWEVEPVCSIGDADAAGLAARTSPTASSSSKKRKLSRWKPAEEVKTVPGLSGTVLPAPPVVDLGPERLSEMPLNEINQKLQLVSSGQWTDGTPAEQRSPSPEPVCNEQGLGSDSRGQQIKAMLQKERTAVVVEMIKKSPYYKPPSGSRPGRKCRRLPIPQDEYPGYNFIGLILGPRGNTQKRMEREAGAKIAIRGKGSAKQGRPKRDGAGARPDPADDEEMHVLITADTEEAVEKAAAMVQKLLVPTDDAFNEHKRKQLMELASLNGTLRQDELLLVQRYAEEGGELFQLPDHSKPKEVQYRRGVSATHGQEAGKVESDGEPLCLQELGGEVPRPELGVTGGREGGQEAGPSLLGFSRDGGNDRPEDDDPRALYVGYLPLSMTEEELARLLKAVGEAEDVRIVKDKHTGHSKGFGFVRMASEEAAAMAVQRLNNHMVKGCRLVVRPRGRSSALPSAPAHGSGHSLPGTSAAGAAAPRPEFDERPPGLEDNEAGPGAPPPPQAYWLDPDPYQAYSHYQAGAGGWPPPAGPPEYHHQQQQHNVPHQGARPTLVWAWEGQAEKYPNIYTAAAMCWVAPPLGGGAWGLGC